MRHKHTQTNMQCLNTCRLLPISIKVWWACLPMLVEKKQCQTKEHTCVCVLKWCISTWPYVQIGSFVCTYTSTCTCLVQTRLHSRQKMERRKTTDFQRLKTHTVTFKCGPICFELFGAWHILQGLQCDDQTHSMYAQWAGVQTELWTYRAAWIQTHPSMLYFIMSAFRICMCSRMHKQ